jgi:hypothetical protein
MCQVWQYGRAHQELEQLAVVVRQFAWVTPRPGEAERTWQSLRSHAQAALSRGQLINARAASAMPSGDMP